MRLKQYPAGIFRATTVHLPTLLLASLLLASLLLAFLLLASCSPRPSPPAEPDPVQQRLDRMTLVEKVSRLFMVPVSGDVDILNTDHLGELQRNVVDFGAGGVVFMAGNPLQHAAVAAWIGSQVDLPLLVALDAEWGTGMRHKDMPVYPRAMGLAASRDVALTREVGYRTGTAALANGINMVFAPVADVNTEPANPVIGTRSFSDHPDTVAVHAVAFARGLRDAGVLAVAKHFPGHGSTLDDSHYALPVSGYSRAMLDAVDLKPFRALFADSIAGVMSAHVLYPDDASHAPTYHPATLDSTILSGLLRDAMGYEGLVVTDALNMVGVTTVGPPDSVAVWAFMAGADVLLMSPDAAASRAAIVRAIRSGRIPMARLDASLRRQFKVRTNARARPDLTTLASLIADDGLASVHIAVQALTLVKMDPETIPVPKGRGRVVVLETDFRSHAVGDGPGAALSARLEQYMPDAIDVVRVSPRAWGTGLRQHAQTIRQAHTVVWLDATGVTPVAGWDMGSFSLALGGLHDRILAVSTGSPWSVPAMAPGVHTLLVTYDTLPPTIDAIARAFTGRAGVTGRLPVHVSDRFPRGSGLDLKPVAPSAGPPHAAGMDAAQLDSIDRIIHAAIADSAFPAATVAVGRGETLVKLAAYGHPTYDSPSLVDTRDIFDLASLTKVIATTTMIMLLVEDGTLELDKPVAEYLPAFAQNNKGMITIRDLLTHSGGLIPFRAFHADGVRTGAEVRRRILSDTLAYMPGTDMRYSDFGPITLVWVVEEVTGRAWAELLQERVFEPLGMFDTGFRAARRQSDPRTIPTERDTYFRNRTLNGEVHDENAWLLGGTAGHAGLFSTVQDLSAFAMMYVNEGRVGDRTFLKPETIQLFTTATDPNGSHTRALGWDTRSRVGYSSAGSHFGPRSFGHTGYTGTSFWIDPDQDLYVILLTNRVYPTRNNSKHVPVRPAVADRAFQALSPRAR